MGWPREGMHTRLLDESFRRGLSHAYLFVGPEGTGKLDTALQFIRKVFCTAPDSQDRPCGNCTACKKISSGNHPDLYLLEPDGQVIKIAQIRELQRVVSLKPVESNIKVYIIQGADRLTPEAANAMLKFLEEPSFPCIGILLANQMAKLLPTIISRCQIISFSLPSDADRIARIEALGGKKEYAKLLVRVFPANPIDPAGLESSGFAEILQLVVQLTEDLLSKQRPHLQHIQDRIIKPGWSQEQVYLFLDCLGLWFRDLLFWISGLQEEIVYTAYQHILQAQSCSYTVTQLMKCTDAILTAKKHLQAHGNLQLTLEAMVLQMQGESNYVFGSRHTL